MPYTNFQHYTSWVSGKVGWGGGGGVGGINPKPKSPALHYMDFGKR